MNNNIKIIIAMLSILLSLSLTPTQWPKDFTDGQKMDAVQFQLLNGSNRITEAQQLLSIFNDQLLMVNEETKDKTPTPKDQTANIQHSTLSIQHYSFSDLKKIFGKPSKINPNGSLTYIYNYTNNNSFTINYNNQNKLIEIKINNIQQ